MREIHALRLHVTMIASKSQMLPNVGPQLIDKSTQLYNSMLIKLINKGKCEQNKKRKEINSAQPLYLIVTSKYT